MVDGNTRAGDVASSGVAIKRISKSYGAKEVYQDFSFHLVPNTITTFLGASGVGKSTLLRMVAGLEPWDSGEIIKPKGRTSMLFQEPILLPWYHVEKNIALPLERIMPPAELAERVSHILEAVELESVRHAKPHQLSGGMKQRVSMARAFAYPSELLLLDEPFQSLDVRLRATLGELFLRLWKEQPQTTLMVTHDIQEALQLSHRVVVLSGAGGGVASSDAIDTMDAPASGGATGHGVAQVVLDLAVPGKVGTRLLHKPPYTEMFQHIYATLLKTP